MSEAERNDEDFDAQVHGAAGEHMKAMWAGQSNVLVAVRVRPLMKHDVIRKSCVRTLDSNVVIVMDPASGDKQDILRANRSREKQYAFDHVFNQNCSQEIIYNTTTNFLIHGVLDGYNATVFAYGQTGSGKTYTMIGTQQDPGIMVRVMSDLFTHSSLQGKQQGVVYKVIASFLEVYNENIRDLLHESDEYLDLREDPIKGPVVAGITEVEVISSEEIMQLLHQGNLRRSQASTAANETSSRSHAVLQVIVECRDKVPGTVANIKVGKLSLVDLAGSERAANTKNRGARLVEGANINRSLLALGNCINALGEKGNKGNFVPYRDSKLTRLLKDSLGGNCRTVMIANISSAESAFEETLNTLKYANRAKNIKSTVQRNVLNVNYHISEYVQLINNLRGEIKVLKDQISSTPAVSSFDPSSPGNARLLPAARSQSRLMPSLSVSIPSPSHSHSSFGFGGARGSASTPGGAIVMGADAESVGDGRELVNVMRAQIVENFQERMQLRRSLIELEDQNVQNSIEVSRRQLLLVQWSGHGQGVDQGTRTAADVNAGSSFLNLALISKDVMETAPDEIKEAWEETEQYQKSINKNNAMKKNIAKRLRQNERVAERFRDELSGKLTGDDRRELMELQYQVGRLELENMELEQHRNVHESIVKGKDLVIQKLRLQLAVKDKLAKNQQRVMLEHGLQDSPGYTQLMLMEQALATNFDTMSAAATGVMSPSRSVTMLQTGNNEMVPSPIGAIGSAIVSQKSSSFSSMMKQSGKGVAGIGNVSAKSGAASASPLLRSVSQSVSQTSKEEAEYQYDIDLNKAGARMAKKHKAHGPKKASTQQKGISRERPARLRPRRSEKRMDDSEISGADDGSVEDGVMWSDADNDNSQAAGGYGGDAMWREQRQKQQHNQYQPVKRGQIAVVEDDSDDIVEFGAMSDSELSPPPSNNNSVNKRSGVGVAGMLMRGAHSNKERGERSSVYPLSPSPDHVYGGAGAMNVAGKGVLGVPGAALKVNSGGTKEKGDRESNQQRKLGGGAGVGDISAPLLELGLLGVGLGGVAGVKGSLQGAISQGAGAQAPGRPIAINNRGGRVLKPPAGAAGDISGVGIGLSLYLQQGQHAQQAVGKTNDKAERKRGYDSREDDDAGPGSSRILHAAGERWRMELNVDVPAGVGGESKPIGGEPQHWSSFSAQEGPLLYSSHPKEDSIAGAQAQAVPPRSPVQLLRIQQIQQKIQSRQLLSNANATNVNVNPSAQTGSFAQDGGVMGKRSDNINNNNRCIVPPPALFPNPDDRRTRLAVKAPLQILSQGNINANVYGDREKLDRQVSKAAERDSEREAAAGGKRKSNVPEPATSSAYDTCAASAVANGIGLSLGLGEEEDYITPDAININSQMANNIPTGKMHLPLPITLVPIPGAESVTGGGSGSNVGSTSESLLGVENAIIVDASGGYKVTTQLQQRYRPSSGPRQTQARALKDQKGAEVMISPRLLAPLPAPGDSAAFPNSSSDNGADGGIINVNANAMAALGVEEASFTRLTELSLKIFAIGPYFPEYVRPLIIRGASCHRSLAISHTMVTRKLEGIKLLIGACRFITTTTDFRFSPASLGPLVKPKILKKGRGKQELLQMAPFTLELIKHNARSYDNIEVSTHAEADKSTNLPVLSRKVQESWLEILLPLSGCNALRDDMTRSDMKTIRYGPLFEICDVLAADVACKHCGGAIDQPLIVTASVDGMRAGDLNLFHDLRLQGFLSYVGNSSMEVNINMISVDALGKEKLTGSSLFIMAARDTVTGKAYSVPRLVYDQYDDVRDSDLAEAGRQRAAVRVNKSKESLLTKEPRQDEVNIMHRLYLESKELRERRYFPQSSHSSFLSSSSPMQFSPVKYMKDWTLTNTTVMLPQMRNVHGNMFGGYVMRVSFELAWTTAMCYLSTDRPEFVAVDDIQFVKPVLVGSVVEFSAVVVYSEGPRIVVQVTANTLYIANGARAKTNVLVFVFRAPLSSTGSYPDHVPQVIPTDYEEFVLYLEGRRALNVMDGRADAKTTI